MIVRAATGQLALVSTANRRGSYASFRHQPPSTHMAYFQFSHQGTNHAANIETSASPLPPNSALLLPALQSNQLTNRVLVTEGAELVQKNFHMDDCILPTMPFTCFTEAIGGGARVSLENVVWTDTSCSRVEQSKGFSAILYAARCVSRVGLTLRRCEVITTARSLPC